MPPTRAADKRASDRHERGKLSGSISRDGISRLGEPDQPRGEGETCGAGGQR